MQRSYTTCNAEQAVLLVIVVNFTLSSMVRHSLFRPCIDLHQGVVKQIVGGSLRDDDRAQERAVQASSTSEQEASSLKTNFTSQLSPAHYAQLYRKNNLSGAHVIKLGPGNDEAARQAVEAWHDGLQVGGGITAENGREWIEKGASKVGVSGQSMCA